MYVDLEVVLRSLGALLDNLDVPSSASAEQVLRATAAVRPRDAYQSTRSEYTAVLAPIEAWAKAHRRVKRGRVEEEDEGEVASEAAMQEAIRTIEAHRYKRTA
jgi:hypothetical protein